MVCGTSKPFPVKNGCLSLGFQQPLFLWSWKSRAVIHPYTSTASSVYVRPVDGSETRLMRRLARPRLGRCVGIPVDRGEERIRPNQQTTLTLQDRSGLRAPIPGGLPFGGACWVVFLGVPVGAYFGGSDQDCSDERSSPGMSLKTAARSDRRTVKVDRGMGW